MPAGGVVPVVSSPIDRGAAAATPAQIPPRGWWQILKRVYAEASADNLGLIAAGVAFYGFLAMVPLLGALVLTYGLLASPADVASHIRELTAQVPADAARLIDEQLTSLVQTSADKKGWGLLLAIALALYGATKGAGALVTALNIVYEEDDKRGFIISNLVNIAITLGAIVVAFALIFAASASHALEGFAGRISPAVALLAKVAGWLLAAAVASGAIAALYRYAPARANARWSWLTPGSSFATIGIVGATACFGWYAASFGNYNATYGSLGAVVVLLFWLYLSAYVLILGGELNAELERQTAADTTTGPERPLGSRNARMADEVAPAPAVSGRSIP